MKARFIIEKVLDNGELSEIYTYTKEYKNEKEFNKEMLKNFSETNQQITVKETKFYPTKEKENPLLKYSTLNNAKMFREFQEKYHYPKMHIYSYRRVLYGESTYLGKGGSPYIADMFKFFSEKLNIPFINVAYDLLDSEYFGRRNTLLDVILAEKDLTKEIAVTILGDIAEELDSIKLADLNVENRKIYEEALSLLK